MFIIDEPTVDAVEDGGDGTTVNRPVGNVENTIWLREIALWAFVEAISIEWLRRAGRAKGRKSVEELDVKSGDLVDIYWAPARKDLSGWRGPCKVVDNEEDAEGRITVKW